jgi:hypothetical protein
VSRSKYPKCPSGKECGVCHPGKQHPPVHVQRQLQDDDLQTQVADAAYERRWDSAEVAGSDCDCFDCESMRMLMSVPVGPPRK